MLKKLLPLGAMCALAAFGAAPVAADTINVSHGESIQSAVNHANPGDVIRVHKGVYHESVDIRKNNLTLKGAGATRKGTVLKPAQSSNKCDNGKAGICIHPHKGHAKKVPTRATKVSGFLITGFDEFGAIAENARKAVFRHDAFTKDGEYGVAAFTSQGTVFAGNRATNAGEAGFYIGDSPRANANVHDNVARHNGEFGFFFRDSSHGLAAGNRAKGNCLGIGVIDSGAPGGASAWTVQKNKVVRNNRFCPSEEEAPPISGTGIGLVGATDSKVKANRVLKNRPSKSGAFAPGGIVLVSGEPLGGAVESGNHVARNRALHNKPDDIVWDGNGSGNTFTGNHCNTSDPSGLCS